MRQPTPSATETVGPQLAHAIADHDADRLRSLFATPVVFRAVTPQRFWDAETPMGVVDVILGTWFDPSKQVTELTVLESDAVGDVGKISYRMAVTMDSGDTMIDQTAYYSTAKGQIAHLRLACSGFRPV